MENLTLKEGSQRKYFRSIKTIDGVQMEVDSGYSHELANGKHLLYVGSTNVFNKDAYERIKNGEFGKYTTYHDVEENTPDPKKNYYYIAEKGI